MKKTLLSIAFSILSLNSIADDNILKSKNISIIVPFNPGGTTDIIARLLAPELQKITSKTFIVENKGGANSIIGTNYVARAKDDGSSLLIGSSAMSLNHAFAEKGTSNKLPYDSLNDLTLVSLIGVSPYLLIVNSNSKYENLNELVNEAKKKVENVSYASAGTGGSPHLGGLLLSQATKTTLLHVPYKGAGPALAAVLSNEVDFTFANYTTAKSFIDSGKVRVLAVAAKDRLEFLPDVPTYSELGISGAEVDSWFGVLIPSKTPEEIKKFYHENIGKIMLSDNMMQRAKQNSILYKSLSFNETKNFYISDINQWTKFILDFKGKLD